MWCCFSTTIVSAKIISLVCRHYAFTVVDTSDHKSSRCFNALCLEREHACVSQADSCESQDVSLPLGTDAAARLGL